jgi:CheY-like chemotaxis protein
MKVLVVDDNADMRDALQLLLAQIGYEVEGAADGLQAIEIQRARPAQVLITDIFMPGKDGFETIEAFRREWPHTRIVAMSGGGALATRDYLKLTPEVGADAILRKPFSLENLQEVLAGLAA